MSNTDQNQDLHPEEGDDFVELRVARDLMRDKIVHTLTIWPILSPSMLQVGIGTSISPKIWHPVLEQLIKDGIITREELRAKSSIGRDQIYTRLSLTSK